MNGSMSSYADLDDCSLVLACQRRDKAAFNTLYKRYVVYVRAILRSLAPDLTQSYDDMTQEVFLRVWRFVDTLKEPRAFRKWLRRVITNLFYDELRRRPAQTVISIDESIKSSEGDDSGAYREIADSKAQPDEVLELNETIVLINAAVEQLPDHYKSVLVLREFYGFSYEEIAHRTKIELGTVKSRISRAKMRMLPQLKTLKAA